MRRKRAENTEFCKKPVLAMCKKTLSLGIFLEDQWKYE